MFILAVLPTFELAEKKKMAKLTAYRPDGYAAGKRQSQGEDAIVPLPSLKRSQKCVLRLHDYK